MRADAFPQRGQIYWIDWEPHRGSEQAGRRPGLVISGDPFNKMFPVCTVLALTTQIKHSRVAVLLPASVTGRESLVLPWQVMTVAQERLDEYIATVDGVHMREIEQKLHLVWAL